MKLSLTSTRLGGEQCMANAGWTSRKHATQLKPVQAQRSRVSCSSAATEPAQLATPGDASPSSWPSEAAREAAYGTVASQEAQGVPAVVRGQLPPWLKGAVLRNGPGTYHGMQHLFDGYALLARLQLDGGSNTVVASHKFVQSDAYVKFKESGGKMAWREFGTPRPHSGPLDVAADVLQTLLGTMGIGDGVTDNPSVSVKKAGEHVLALTETVRGTFRVDPTTLDTLERVKYEDGIKGDLTTAHPTVLPNGDLINFVSTVGVGYTLYRQSASEPFKRNKIVTVPARHLTAPAWIHDFPVSHNYAVLPETPLYFNLWNLLSGTQNEHVFMDWKPEEGSLFHVASLDGKQVKSYKAPPCFVFHWVNAFESEDGRYLHLDASVYDDPTIVGDLYLDRLRAGYKEGAGGKQQVSPSYYRRLTIDLQAPSGSQLAGWERLVDDELTHGNFFEFPAINNAWRGKAYRYAYGSCATRPTNAANSLVKFDNRERTCKVWHEAGSLVGEPLFVEAPNGQSEDDGVVLVLLAQADGKAALLVLEGGSFHEVARAVLPYSLPSGFHGTFLRG